MDNDHLNFNKIINYLSYFICITSVFVILTTVISVISRKRECDTGWIEYDSLCYKLYLDLEWEDAFNKCDKEYSSLVQVTDKNVYFFNNVNVGCFWMKNKVVSNYTSVLKSGELEMSFTYPVVTCACYENNKIIPSDCKQNKSYVCYR
ncbi:C-type lectin-like protein [Cheloniid poxvirus 1]|nr:C-type lectin-like protein [Cheloniid poxvirus 1]